MKKDMSVRCSDGVINIRVGAIIIKERLIYEPAFYFYMKVPMISILREARSLKTEHRSIFNGFHLIQKRPSIPRFSKQSC